MVLGAMLYKKLIGIFVALVAVVGVGVSGYQLIEKWPPLDALYMTVITLSSVGFAEVHPLSSTGRIFTMLLILCGSGVLVYGISVVTAFVVEGELTDALRRRKMNKKIEMLSGHYIVCGADHTGHYVIEELMRTKRDFVVIEKDPEKIRGLMDRNILCVPGDATHDAVLLKTGIKRAEGFITSLHTDAENVFVVITAKRLNPALKVVSKAVEEESEQKIRMVGADCVVMPNYIGGLRMVSELIRPSVVSFLDIMLRTKDRTIRVEEIEIPAGSGLVGKTIRETGITTVEGVTLVALKEREGEAYKFNPSPSLVLSEESILILMGDIELIRQVEERAKTSGLS